MRMYESYREDILIKPLDLHVQKFIRKEGLERLKEKYAITVKEYARHLLLNYSMVESPKFSPVVMDCRALVLDKFDLSVAGRSFRRFFNYGEHPSSKNFDFSRVGAAEKIDGTLIYVWWNKYEEMWQVSTRKMLYAEGPLPNGTSSFDAHVRKTFSKPLEELFGIDERDRTFVFEFVSPQSRVTTLYPERALYLLTIVENNQDIEYYQADTISVRAFELGVLYPNRHMTYSMEMIQQTVDELTIWDEGFVLFHINGMKVDRLKFKNKDHFEMSKMRNNGGTPSEKGICKYVMTFEEDEYLIYFAQDIEYFQPYLDARELLLTAINNTWEENKCIEIQKDFAVAIKDIPYSGILFSMRKGLTIEEALERVTDSSKRALLLLFKTLED